MSNVLLASILLVAASMAPASASAMSGSASPCRLVGAEKLPREVGGGEAVCRAIQQAIAAKAPNSNYSVHVEVLSKSSVKATVELNGRRLPEQRISVMDRDLNLRSIGRFAEKLAEEAAKAARQS